MDDRGGSRGVHPGADWRSRRIMPNMPQDAPKELALERPANVPEESRRGGQMRPEGKVSLIEGPVSADGRSGKWFMMGLPLREDRQPI